MVSIDHLGLSKAGLPDLLRLAERGVYVKATGSGGEIWTSPPPFVHKLPHIPLI